MVVVCWRSEAVENNKRDTGRSREEMLVSEGSRGKTILGRSKKLLFSPTKTLSFSANFSSTQNIRKPNNLSLSPFCKEQLQYLFKRISPPRGKSLTTTKSYIRISFASINMPPQAVVRNEADASVKSEPFGIAKIEPSLVKIEGSLPVKSVDVEAKIEPDLVKMEDSLLIKSVDVEILDEMKRKLAYNKDRFKMSEKIR